MSATFEPYGPRTAGDDTVLWPMVHFGGDGRRDHKFPGLLLQQRLDQRLHRVSPIGHRNKWGRVEDERQEPKPLRSSSSLKSATDSPGPSALPTSEKSRFPRRSGSYRRMARRMTSACDIPSRSAKVASRATSSGVK